MPPDASYQSRDVRHFERWSQSYEGSWMQRRLFSRVHTAVLDLAASLSAPASVLDVGCGTGRLLRTAAARWPYAQLIGVDPAQGMVDVARKLTPDATFYRGLAESLPLPDASVDLVFSTLSFHHWADQTAGVREIARALRPGGHFILADFAPPNGLARLRVTGRALPAADRLRVFAAAGLRVERQQGAVYPFILATLAVR
ncbi:MAG TPA: class I SAM-dependent methyltransferase [Ktedonobacterales bacterium]|jgi:ubiquinone/menaquinone biosynthesis C-methylase UbiE|nr:class I SAM-dependent methyltransferase [Ktedonobacterales bacterium]